MVGVTRHGVAIAGVVLCLSSVACSRKAASPDTAAIESAYRSGILTKEEYTARRAAAQNRAARLAALNTALQAGVLSQQEYAAKKAALLTLPAAAEPAPAPAADIPAAPQVAETAASPTPKTDPSGHLYRMKVAQVVDAQGYEKPIPSASLLIPVDWKSQGATTWNLKDKCSPVQTHVVANGPDGRAFERFPEYHWVWADDPRPLQASFEQTARMGTHACDVMAPMSAQDYLRRNLSKIRPGAQLVGFEPAPTLMDALAQQARQTEEGARQYNLKEQVKYDAIKARVTYSVDGKPMEEWILAATVATGILGPLQKWTYNCVAYTGAQRAPAGKLDSSLKLFELIASTYHVEPEWQARITKGALTMQQIELKGIRDRSAIMAKSAEDQRNMQREMYESRQKVVDSTNEQFSQVIRGVETYRNPGTGTTIELDNRYGHAWVNNAGEYLLTDQLGFDPNTVQGNTQSWTQLQHVKQ